MSERTGVLFVGALGAVATTTIAGLIAVNQKLAPLRGLISTEPVFVSLDLVPLRNLVFGGWDIRKALVSSSVLDHGIVPENIRQKICGELDQIEVWPAPLTNVGDYVRNVYGVHGTSPSLIEAVELIKQHIEHFKRRHGIDRVVVINTASTEENTDSSPIYESLTAFEKAMRSNSSEIRPGMLYAYAALQSGCAYVNFTPSVTVEIPALQELAEMKSVPFSGKDGRTGQTLYKHVLGKMFKVRGMKVTGWYSTNILGNEDGAVLDYPAYRETKIESKERGLEGILGYSDFDHRVRIDYFPIRRDRKEAWDAIDFEGWLGVQMSMKINWLGSDSILAAPLIVDLVRFMDHALRQGKSGAMTHLSLFFKSPYAVEEYALDEQYRYILEYAKAEASLKLSR